WEGSCRRRRPPTPGRERSGPQRSFGGFPSVFSLKHAVRRRAAKSKTERQLFHAKSKTERQFFHMGCRVAGSAFVNLDRQGCLGTARGQKINQMRKFVATICQRSTSLREEKSDDPQSENT